MSTTEVIVTLQVGAGGEGRRPWHDYIQTSFQTDETIDDVMRWAREKADAREARVIKIEIREDSR